MNVLVTGGLGYIGSRLVSDLVRLRHATTVAARESPNLRGAAAEGRTVRVWDVRESYDEIVNEPYDAVIHLAAANDVDSRDPQVAMDVNVRGTRNVVEFCTKWSVPWIIYVSTFQVYGTWEGTVDDASEAAPIGDYALTHWLAEECIRSHARRGGLAYTILRPTNVYGAPVHRHIDRWSLVPNCFCREAFETASITLRSSGRQQRDFVSLPALSVRIGGVLERPSAHRNQTYVVGSGESTTVREVADLVAERYERRFGRSCSLKILSDEPKSTVRLSVSSARSLHAGLFGPSPESMADEVDRIFDRLEGN